MPESEIKSHLAIDVFGSLLESEYMGKVTIEFRISDYITKG